MRDVIFGIFGVLWYIFVSPVLGKFIAVKIFKCPEWDKKD